MNWDWLWWIPVAPFIVLLVVGPLACWLDNRELDRMMEESRARSRAAQRDADEYKRLKDERNRMRVASTCGFDEWHQEDLVEINLATGEARVLVRDGESVS